MLIKLKPQLRVSAYFLVVKVKVMTTYEPSGPSGQSVSWFL